MDASNPLLTTDEVAAYLKVDVVTVRRLVTRHELAAYRIGNEYRFAPNDLCDYLQRQHLPATSGDTAPASTFVQQIVQQFGRLVPKKAPGSVRLTKRVRQVLNFAADAAREGGQSPVGTEHLLVGLLREESGIAARVLHEHDVTLERVRAVAAPAEGWPEATAHAPSPAELTPQAQAVLGASIEQATAWQHEYVGTEHLLYALATVADTNARAVLAQLEVPAEAFQARLADLSVTHNA